MNCKCHAGPLAKDPETNHHDIDILKYFAVHIDA